MLAALIGVFGLAGRPRWSLGPLPRSDVGPNDLAELVIVMAAITWTVFWFARHSRQRGWLR